MHIELRHVAAHVAESRVLEALPDGEKYILGMQRYENNGIGNGATQVMQSEIAGTVGWRFALLQICGPAEGWLFLPRSSCRIAGTIADLWTCRRPSPPSRPIFLELASELLTRRGGFGGGGGAGGGGRLMARPRVAQVMWENGLETWYPVAVGDRLYVMCANVHGGGFIATQVAGEGVWGRIAEGAASRRHSLAEGVCVRVCREGGGVVVGAWEGDGLLLERGR